MESFFLSGCAGSSLLLGLFSGCGAQAPGPLGFRRCGLPGSGARAQYVWCTGLAAPWHEGSSQIRDQTCAPCIGKPILYYCATREAPLRGFLMVIKTLPVIGRWVPQGFSSCGFQDSLASCKVGTASPLLQVRKVRLREVLKVPYLITDLCCGGLPVKG